MAESSSLFKSMFESTREWIVDNKLRAVGNSSSSPPNALLIYFTFVLIPLTINWLSIVVIFLILISRELNCWRGFVGQRCGRIIGLQLVSAWQAQRQDHPRQVDHFSLF